MANDYCTLAEIKADMPEAGINSTTDYDAAIEVSITDASRAIDREVGGWPGYFYPTTDGETRYYDGSGSSFLDIDACQSITTVSVSEDGSLSSSDYTDWTNGTDYYTWPYNAIANSEPIRRLVIDWNGGQVGWTNYPKAVKIAGIFGRSTTVPNDVKRACKIQAYRYFMRSKQAYQNQGAGGSAGSLTFNELDPDVAQILAHYKIESAVL